MSNLRLCEWQVLPGMFWAGKKTVAWNIHRKKGSEKGMGEGGGEGERWLLKLQRQRELRNKFWAKKYWRCQAETRTRHLVLLKRTTSRQKFSIFLWLVAAPIEQHLAFDSSQQGMAVIHALLEQLFARKHGLPAFSESLVDKIFTQFSFHSNTFESCTVPTCSRREKK